MYSQLQLEAAINRLMRAESEAEQDVMCAEISKHVADPSWMDLIFQSNEFVMPDGSLDVPEIARRVLEYLPVSL